MVVTNEALEKGMLNYVWNYFYILKTTKMVVTQNF